MNIAENSSREQCPRLKGTKETNGEFASPLNIHPLWPSDFILYHKMINGLGNRTYN